MNLNLTNKLLSTSFGAIIGLYPVLGSAQGAEPYMESDISPHTYYFTIGVNGDVPLNGGYESALIKRDPRLDYKVELGTSWFAIPFHYSTGQGVDIFGLKPRVQFLFPIITRRVLIGPGLGGVVNYWRSGFDILGSEINSNVLEVGAQASIQAVIRPMGPFVITITPVAVDFNFYRNAWISRNQREVGNFSTTNRDLGIIYSGGIGVGIGF